MFAYEGEVGWVDVELLGRRMTVCERTQGKYLHAGKYSRGELAARPHLSVCRQCFLSHRRNETSFGGYACKTHAHEC